MNWSWEELLTIEGLKRFIQADVWRYPTYQPTQSYMGVLKSIDERGLDMIPVGMIFQDGMCITKMFANPATQN